MGLVDDLRGNAARCQVVLLHSSSGHALLRCPDRNQAGAPDVGVKMPRYFYRAAENVGDDPAIFNLRQTTHHRRATFGGRRFVALPAASDEQQRGEPERDR